MGAIGFIRNSLSTPFKKNDRRSIGRTKIAKGAVLSFSGQTGVRSCCVTDITNVGAGIRVRGLAVLPLSFELSFDNLRTIRKCRAGVTASSSGSRSKADRETSPSPVNPTGWWLDCTPRTPCPRLYSGGGAMKQKDQISEREYQDRLKGLLKSAFNTQLQPLRSLRTATKKRRALKKKAAKYGHLRSDLGN
jgi:hypothetical protein